MTDTDTYGRCALALETHERRCRAMALETGNVQARERLLGLAKKARDVAEGLRELMQEALR